MKITICPNCGHGFYCDAAYATCDACQCLFYANQSSTCTRGKSYAAGTPVPVTNELLDDRVQLELDKARQSFDVLPKIKSNQIKSNQIKW